MPLPMGIRWGVSHPSGQTAICFQDGWNLGKVENAHTFGEHNKTIHQFSGTPLDAAVIRGRDERLHQTCQDQDSGDFLVAFGRKLRTVQLVTLLLDGVNSGVLCFHSGVPGSICLCYSPHN